jgi:hypothetical protein
MRPSATTIRGGRPAPGRSRFVSSPRVAVLSARVLVGESLELDEQVFVCATARWRAVI